MKKNSEFVGVDEEFIPKNEEFVDESIVKDKEKSKKITKRFGKAYIIFFSCFFVIVLGGIIYGFVNFFNMEAKADVNSFNTCIEQYSGTNYSSRIESMLEEVIKSNKKEKDRTINVKYNDIDTSDEEKIIEIKHSLDDGHKYEVIMDYDSKGYINKVTIKDIKNESEKTEQNTKDKETELKEEIENKAESVKENVENKVDANSIKEEVQNKVEEAKEYIQSEEGQKQIEDAQKKAQDYINSEEGKKKMEEAQKKAQDYMNSAQGQKQMEEAQKKAMELRSQMGM